MKQPTRLQLEKIEKFVNAHADDAEFLVLVGWMKDELAARDVENRKKGFENSTSEASALELILKYLAPERQLSIQMPK